MLLNDPHEKHGRIRMHIVLLHKSHGDTSLQDIAAHFGYALVKKDARIVMWNGTRLYSCTWANTIGIFEPVLRVSYEQQLEARRGDLTVKCFQVGFWVGVHRL